MGGITSRRRGVVELSADHMEKQALAELDSPMDAHQNTARFEVRIMNAE
jgi:hypothetical protein